MQDFFKDVGLRPKRALELANLVGLVGCVLVIAAASTGSGVAGAKSVGGGFTTRKLARRFVHTLVPIALAYVAAHYMTQLLFQGQAMAYLASDPLGHGWNLFGGARRRRSTTGSSARRRPGTGRSASSWSATSRR